jgi:hypothetical protein
MPIEHKDSIFSRRFNIPSIQSKGAARWNNEWEKVLRTLSASEDVFPFLSRCWTRDKCEPSELAHDAQLLKDKLCKDQEIIAGFWEEGTEWQFVTGWLLLAEAERKRHLLKGLEDACGHASWGHDGRALCPEITLTLMLRQGGRAFTDFFTDYGKGKKDVGEDNVYFLPSEWWDKAVDRSKPLSDEDEFTFRILTIQRNEFITQFLMHSGLSVLHDFTYGSPGMTPAINMMKADGIFARGMSETLSGMRSKPLIRCENCAKSSEEIGANAKFMVCSCCNSKLNLAVHYCSAACQKADWRNHKKHCGKKKVLKNVKGTAHDPFWNVPDFPDHLRPTESSANGTVNISSVGFGTAHPSRPHTPALQRQVSLLNADKRADYYLFDESDQPVRVVFPDIWMKMVFRTNRADAMFGARLDGLPAMAEHLIKIMEQKPRFSRAMILDQFTREYGEDMVTKVAEWEGLGVANGYEPGVTFLETMSRNLAINETFINEP